MNAVEVRGLSYRYDRTDALRDIDLEIPEGALYALLGRNGSGKTTLLQTLIGLKRPRTGHVTLFGTDRAALTWHDRMSIGYVAEGQSLPVWMKIEELERYLAPLYPTWDADLANKLRDRFSLDATRRIRTLSRGEYMKAALLVALAPRPRLLLMDEPFTGMDAIVKDELVRGLLESAGAEGWTVMLSSHDIGELELLADWVGLLDGGRLILSEPMESLRGRFKHVDVVLRDAAPPAAPTPADWLGVERAGSHVSFVTSRGGDGALLEGAVRSEFPNIGRLETRDATLREVFVALAKPSVRTMREAA